MPASRGPQASLPARALCAAVAALALSQTAALIVDAPRFGSAPNPPLAPLALSADAALADAGAAALGGAPQGASADNRLRDGLASEPPGRQVSLLVHFRGDPIANVLLALRDAYGPQRGWSPPVIEVAREAIARQNAALEAQRTQALRPLAAAGFASAPARDYRYLVNGINLRDLPVEAVPLLALDPDVLLIERDQVVHIDLPQSVPLINADDVWNTTDASGLNITGVGAVIANIDTGVDYTHPDLGGTLNRANDFANFTAGTHRKFVGGWDFVNNDNDPYDDHFHGTHVAGIIAANGTLKGVAPGAKELALKVLSASGSGSDSDVIAAMEFATDPDRNPLTDDAADASSMSLGAWDPNPDGLEPTAADTSAQLGTLCIIAAGNDGLTSSVGSPGVSRKSITVGSTTKSDVLSSFSSQGPTLGFDLKPDLVAPGSSIISTASGGAGGNRTLSGTSMATPHVSGVVALLKQAHPNWTVDEVKSALVDRAKDVGYGVFQQGGGRLDAMASVNDTVAALPYKLAMGRLSRLAAQTNATVTFENLGNASVALNLSARDVFGMYPNMTYVNNNTDLNFVVVVPSTVTLAPGGRASVTVVFAPPASATPGHYWGAIVASAANLTVSVPFAYYVRAPILLVDDDSSDRWSGVAPFDNFAGFPSASNNVSFALLRLGYTHDIFTAVHYTDNGPDLLDLLNYPVVVWDTGYDYDYSDAVHTHHTVSARDRQVLAAYLDRGGQLWLTGESIAWDVFSHANATVPAADFFNAYLGVSRVDNELNTPSPLNGSASTFMAGASYTTAADWTDYFNKGDFATNLTPSGRGVTVLRGNTTDIYGKTYANASLAVAVNNSTYRSVFWGSEFSWLHNNTNFDDAVNRTMNFFNVSRNLTLPSDDLAVDVLVDPYKSDWLTYFNADWGRPFDDLAHAGVPFNATVTLRNFGSTSLANVSVNVTLRDNTTAVEQTVQLLFPDAPALTGVAQRAQLTAPKHGYFTVNASLNRSDANASNNADESALLVPNFEEEVGNASAWNASGDWRVSSAWSYSASSSFRVGAKNSANDTLTSPLLNLSRVNASSITGGARLYFEMSGVVSGGDTAYFETRNTSNATWVTQRTLSAFNSPASWNYFLQGVDLTNIANTTGYFRARFQTGASSSSYLYLDHFIVWTYHERGDTLDPAIAVLNATRNEGQLLDFRGSHGNPQNSSNFTYAWNFGDGASAATRNATHAYGDAGTYIVQFTVNDGAGLNETALYSLAVANVAPNVTSASGSPSPSLEGSSVNFSGNCTDAGFLDALTLTWNFGDGSSNATGTAVNHTFANQGSYTVTATCSDGDGGVTPVSFAQNVTNVAPTVASTNASASPSDEGAAVAFSGVCTDPGTLDTVTYTWNFGDGGGNATGATVNHTFANQGNYTVTLTCSDGDGGAANRTRTQSVRNVAPSVASSSSSANPSDEGSRVNFTANCTDPGPLDVVSYAWSFGDGGGNATGSAPNHTYANQGNYTVTLTCSDGDGGATQSTFVQTVRNVAPVAALPTASGPLLEGSNITFNASCTDAGTLDTITYSWNFGDGSPPASGTSQVHAFADDGSYTVTLTCSDGDGGVATRQLVLAIANVAPTVTLAGANATTEGALVLFSSTVTDPGVRDTFTFSLDFGDGSPAAATASASHRFADNGVYTVVMSVRDNAGGLGQATLVVTVQNVAPLPSIAAPSSASEGDTLAFGSTVVDPGILDTFTYLWQFGDGTVSTLANPAHAFANNGSFSVTLTVTDNDGGSGTAVALVTVLNLPPTLLLSAVEGSAFEGSNTTFTVVAGDPGPLDALTLTLSFGDGSPDFVLNGARGLHTVAHAFPNEGSYRVAATLSDGDGGTNASALTFTVLNAAPTILVEASATVVDENSSVAFTALVADAGPFDVLTVTWSWRDLTAVGQGRNASRLFLQDGNYTVNATVTDDAGASASVELMIVVRDVAPTLTLTLPPSVAEGIAAPFAAAAFDRGPLDTVTVFWQWGDGTNSTGLAFDHTYPDVGNYSLSVTATDDAGLSSTLTRAVAVVNTPPRVTSVDIQGALVEGSPLHFVPTVENPARDLLTYAWLFGDGGSSALAAPNHTYVNDGAYSVLLTVTDPEGSFAPFGKSFVVANAAPNLTCQVCPSDAIQGQPIAVRAHATDPGRNDTVTYTLTLPNGTVLSSPDGRFDFVLEEAGELTLNLTASDGEGGNTTLPLHLTVEPDFDRDGIPDAIDPDDDNDGVPDVSDPAPFDPSVGPPKATAPSDSGLSLLLLLGLLAAAGALVAFWRLRRLRR